MKIKLSLPPSKKSALELNFTNQVYGNCFNLFFCFFCGDHFWEVVFCLNVLHETGMSSEPSPFWSEALLVLVFTKFINLTVVSFNTFVHFFC